MNITMHLAVVAVVCLCLAEAGPEVRVARAKQRPTRGFKNLEMMTARGFGKRDRPATRAEHYNYEEPARKKFNPKSSLMVASDFGKRSGDDDSEEDSKIREGRGKFKPSKVLIARDYGKRDDAHSGVYGLDNFWEMLEASPERDGQEDNDDKAIESIPLDWFVNEMTKNPEFTRSVVRKFVDLNQDGQLTSDELLRNPV